MRKRYQSGAVSLFLVVFATLLISVVTVSFLRTMIQDQVQATNLDLSQSAYDSAQAGVQDAERAILRYLSACAGGTSGCDTTQLSSDTCNQGLSSVVDTSDPSGVKVQQSSANGSDLQQYYTCVKISLDTANYVGLLNPNETKVIPLTGASDFDTVEIDWYTADDLGSANKTVSVSNQLSPEPLLSTALWKSTKPSLMQAQLYQFGSNGFTLSDLDQAGDSNTVFLYPSCNIGGGGCLSTPGSGSFSADARTDNAGTPIDANCVNNLGSTDYACKEQLTLPNPVNGGTRTAFLNIKPFYNATHYSIQLLKNGSVVNFSGIQPSVDSTGRANDVFRRVESRIDLANASFPYPSNAVDITGGFCKNFAITNNAADYQTVGLACNP